jgi:uncharacterized membrane protein YfhO
VQIEVTAEQPGYLVLADTAYPGWQAEVDGKPVSWLYANLAFRAVAVAAGSHSVRWIYRPASLLLGEAISLLALAALVGGVWIKRR